MDGLWARIPLLLSFFVHFRKLVFQVPIHNAAEQVLVDNRQGFLVLHLFSQKALFFQLN